MITYFKMKKKERQLKLMLYGYLLKLLDMLQEESNDTESDDSNA